MIPVARVDEPDGFESEVKIPGNEWLKKNPRAKRPSPLWVPYTKVLAEGFGDLCGYAAMLDPTGGTVDHFISFKNDKTLVYEWNNYRFASATLNSSKKSADDSVLDPYDVGPDWFEIILPSLQMKVAHNVPVEYREKAEFTLKRLKLRDGERIIRWRESWYKMYREKKLSIEGLRQVAPLLAAAVEKQTQERGVV